MIILNKRYIIVFLGWVLSLASATFLLNMKNKDADEQNRKKWAYPAGVIAVARISSLKLQDMRLTIQQAKDEFIESLERKKHKEEESRLKKQVSLQIESMSMELEECAGRKREMKNELKLGQLVSFDLSTKVSVTGKTLDITLNERSPGIDLTECIALMMVKMQDIDFPARMLATSVDLSLHFEVRFLADEEAMGKGYLYQLAEEKWLKIKQSRNQQWRKCDQDKNCTIVHYNCEVDAINLDSIGEYEKASMERRKPSCNESRSNDQRTQNKFRASCRKKLCTVTSIK